MKTQIAGGVHIEYDDAGKGKPIVLLHAFPLARTMWRSQIEELQNHYRLIAPDLRGFGGSDGFTGSPSIEAFADDTASLLDALKISEPVVLAGLSMGGYIALAFAHKYPARLRALVLADTRAEADTTEGKANREKMRAFAQNHTAQDVIDQLLPKLVSDETRTHEPDVVAEVRRIASAQSTSGIISALQAMRDRPAASPWLDQIGVPTLVIVGSEDALTPPALAQALVERIRDARLATLNGAGHLSNLEQPELFNVALRSFLQKL
jgi:3-oxoadipate enol-lactonase